jgi:hypothetical protein
MEAGFDKGSKKLSKNYMNFSLPLVSTNGTR